MDVHLLHSEHHLMRALTFRKTPCRLQVLGEIFGILKSSNYGAVDSFLVCSFRLGERFLIFGLAIIKELFLR